MKIIGERKEGYYKTKYMVEMSDDEFGMLLGYYSESSIPDELKKRIKAGSEVDIGAMYKRISALDEYARELNSAKELLLRCASYVDITRDAVAQLLKEEPTT